MNKYLTIAATLALGLGAASAQETTVVAAPVQVTNFTDIPAGHWAKDAVAIITAKGLIQGFPDGTYRGNENLTRYQAALIFARLLQTGGLSNGGLTAEQVSTITKGMQDVSTELAAVSTRVSDLEKASADQQARIDALEGKIDSAANANNTELTARVDALEAAVKAIPAPAAPVDLTNINNRLAALEARPMATPAPTTTIVTTPAVPTPSAPTTIYVDGGSDNGDMGMGLYAGIDTAFNFGGYKGGFSVGNNSSNSNDLPFISSFGGTVGASNVIFGLGARANVDYTPRTEAINGDINLMYTLGNGSAFSPYVGVGFGAVSSTIYPTAVVPAPTAKATDLYVNALLGVDFRVAGSLGIFAEANGKYFWKNQGIGTNLVDSDTRHPKASGFVPSAKIGLKYFF